MYMISSKCSRYPIQQRHRVYAIELLWSFSSHRGCAFPNLLPLTATTSPFCATRLPVKHSSFLSSARGNTSALFLYLHELPRGFERISLRGTMTTLPSL